jgi:hypothetical protein
MGREIRVGGVRLGERRGRSGERLLDRLLLTGVRLLDRLGLMGLRLLERRRPRMGLRLRDRRRLEMSRLPVARDPVPPLPGPACENPPPPPPEKGLCHTWRGQNTSVSGAGEDDKRGPFTTGDAFTRTFGGCRPGRCRRCTGSCCQS